MSLKINIGLGPINYRTEYTGSKEGLYSKIAPQQDLVTGIQTSLYSLWKSALDPKKPVSKRDMNALISGLNQVKNYFIPGKDPERTQIDWTIGKLKNVLANPTDPASRKSLENTINMWGKQFAGTPLHINPGAVKKGVYDQLLSLMPSEVDTGAIPPKARKDFKAPAVSSKQVVEPSKVSSVSVAKTFNWRDIQAGLRDELGKEPTGEEIVTKALELHNEKLKQGLYPNPESREADRVAILEMVGTYARAGEIKQPNLFVETLKSIPKTPVGKLLGKPVAAVFKVFGIIPDIVGKFNALSGAVGEEVGEWSRKENQESFNQRVAQVIKKTVETKPREAHFDALNAAGIVPLVLGTQLEIWRKWKYGDMSLLEGKPGYGRIDKMCRNADPYFQKFMDSGEYDKFIKNPSKLAYMGLIDKPGLKEYIKQNKDLAEGLSELTVSLATLPLTNAAIAKGGQVAKQAGQAMNRFRAQNYIDNETLKLAAKAKTGKWTWEPGRPGETPKGAFERGKELGRWKQPWEDEAKKITEAKSLQTKRVFGSRSRQAADRLGITYDGVTETKTGLVAKFRDTARKGTGRSFSVPAGQDVKTVLREQRALRLKSVAGGKQPVSILPQSEAKAKTSELVAETQQDVQKIVNETAEKFGKFAVDEQLFTPNIAEIVKASKPPTVRMLWGHRPSKHESAALNRFYQEVDDAVKPIRNNVDDAYRRYSSRIRKYGPLDEKSNEYVPKILNRWELVDRRTGNMIETERLAAIEYLQGIKDPNGVRLLTDGDITRLLNQAEETRRLTQELRTKGTALVFDIAKKNKTPGLPDELGYQEKYWPKKLKPGEPDPNLKFTPGAESALFPRAVHPDDVADLNTGLNILFTRDVRGARVASCPGWKIGNVLDDAAREAERAFKSNDARGFMRVKGAIDNFTDPALPGVSEIPHCVQKAYNTVPFLSEVVNFPSRATIVAQLRLNPAWGIFNQIEERTRLLLLGQGKEFLRSLKPSILNKYKHGFKNAYGETINFGWGGAAELVKPSQVVGGVSKRRWLGRIKVPEGVKKAYEGLPKWIQETTTATRNMLGEEKYWEVYNAAIKSGLTKAVAHEQAFRTTSELVENIYIGAREANKLGYTLTRFYPYANYTVGSVWSGLTTMMNEPRLVGAIHYCSKFMHEAEEAAGKGRGGRELVPGILFHGGLGKLNQLDIFIKPADTVEKWLKENDDEKFSIGLILSYMEVATDISPAIIYKYFTDRTGITDERWKTLIPALTAIQTALSSASGKNINFFDLGLQFMAESGLIGEVDTKPGNELSATRSFEKQVDRYDRAWDWYCTKHKIFNDRDKEFWTKWAIRENTRTGWFGLLGLWTSPYPDWLREYDEARAPYFGKMKEEPPIRLNEDSKIYQEMEKILTSPSGYNLTKEQAKYLIYQMNARKRGEDEETKPEDFVKGGKWVPAIKEVPGISLSKCKEYQEEANTPGTLMSDARFDVRLNPNAKTGWQSYFEQGWASRQSKGYDAQVEWYLNLPESYRLQIMGDGTENYPGSLSAKRKEQLQRSIDIYNSKLKKEEQRKKQEARKVAGELSTPEEVMDIIRENKETTVPIDVQLEKIWHGEMIDFREKINKEIDKGDYYNKFYNPPKSMNPSVYRDEVLVPLRQVLDEWAEYLKMYQKYTGKEFEGNIIGIRDFSKEALDKLMTDQHKKQVINYYKAAF